MILIDRNAFLVPQLRICGQYHAIRNDTSSTTNSHDLPYRYAAKRGNFFSAISTGTFQKTIRLVSLEHKYVCEAKIAC